MKTFLKILGFFVLFVLVILYICFLFVVPKVVDINPYKSELQKIVKEQADLDLNYDNAEVVTTPFLGVGVKAYNINVKLPDKTDLFTTDSIKAVVSLPKLLLLTVNVPCLEVDNPFFNIEILENGENYKIVKLIEDILNTQKEATFGQKPIVENDGFQFNPEWIKIILPKIKFKNYKILVTDLASKHYLDLHGDELVVGYINGKRLKIKTNAELYSDENKNITANIDINTFLPEPAPKLDEEDDPAEKISIPFVNPVTTYQNYDLKTNINSKIKINSDKNGQITSFGFFDIDDLTAKISTIQLPKSYLHLKTFGTNADIDTNINVIDNEKINIFGKFNYGKRPKADLNIKTEKITFANLLNLAKAFLESLQIPHELNQYKANGSIIADCSIKTNFKKLKSNGFIKIDNGGLEVRNLGEVLSKANINILLNDNSLDISKSTLFINNSEVNINGGIDKKSNIDINIKTEKLPLSPLFNAFAPEDLRNNFNLKSGDVTSVFDVKGKIKDALIKTKFSLNDFDFSDKQNTFNIKNKKFNTIFDLNTKSQNLSGKILNENFEFLFPKTKSNISIPDIKINVSDKNIEIEQNLINFNDKSVLIYSGNIINYEKPQSIDFMLQGGINTDDIIKFIGKEMKPFINSKGSIPIDLSFSGDNKKQTLSFKALADGERYITPINFDSLKNIKTSLQTTINFKPNRIKIKDTGLYTISYVYDEEGNEQTVFDKVIGVDGTLEGDTINLLKIDMPQNLAGNIYVFPQSRFNLDTLKLYIYGQTSNPLIKGDIKIQDINIPEILIYAKEIITNFDKDNLKFDLKEILLGDSDLNINGKYNLKSENNTEINDLNVISKYFNVDDTVVVSEKISAYVPQSSSNNQSTQANADIPVVINNGKMDMKKIKTGEIILDNAKTDFSLKNNVLALNKFNSDIFKGKINGDILVNLVSMMIKIDLDGQNIDVEKALLDSAGMKDALSGRADFKAQLLVDSGAKTPEEQLKGINGDIDFIIKNGQFGPFGRLENLIIAQNIRESQFFQTALGGIISAIATVDTTHFDELKGHINLNDGNCNINPITSKGNAMNVHILGDYDLLKNYTEMKVRIKLTSIVSNLLGPLNAINPVNLMNSAASTNVVTAKAFSLFCETVPEEEMTVMPNFDNSYIDMSATKFQLGVRGDVAKPLTLIKSFKWLATQKQFDEAEAYVESLPEPIENSQAETIEEAIQEVQALEAEKKTLKYKLKHIIKKENK